MNDFKSKGRLNSEIINELKQNGEEEQKADRRKIFCSAYANICGFTKYKTILGFGQAISSGIISMHMTNDKKNQQNRFDDSKFGQNCQTLT